jgi:DHA1 family bicyclomycin/chloramphenicol resistance-like MFS transporter
MDNEKTTRQKYLGKAGLVIFLGAISAFPALSTDMYLPALPDMTAYFGVPEYQTNLTLILFFIFYAAALLLWGPFSDRFGRRPVLLLGMTAYALAGLACALSQSIFQLMTFRVLQAIGAAAASTVATAIVKDTYEGRRRETTLAVVQSMTVFAPLIAPILGGQILRFTSWRGVFVFQASWGLLMLIGSVLYRETLREKLVGKALASLKRLGVVLQNRHFVLMLITFTSVTITTMAFVAASSYIYQVTFGTSEQTFSFFFAMVGGSVALGPPLFLLLSRWLERTTIITVCLLTVLIGGVLVMILGPRGPWAFILPLMPTAISRSCMRPPATYLMLAQHEADAGSMSGIILSAHMILGSVITVIVSLDIWNRVELVGALTAGLALLSVVLWLLFGLPRARLQAAGS